MTPIEEQANDERRREPRVQASGVVELSVSDPILEVFQGDLMDISQSGFRVSHRNVSLKTGQQVRYRHPHGEGTAKVMWTRIAAGQIESGFLVAEN